jgi:hypothetical protein
MRAGWVALVWVHQRAGSKLKRTSVTCFYYAVGVVCFTLREIPTSTSNEWSCIQLFLQYKHCTAE